MNPIQNSVSFTLSEPQVLTSSAPITRLSQLDFKCELCGTYFSSKHCLTEHGYRHTGQRTYSCRICAKTFKYASQLSVHKKSHAQNLKIRWPKLTELLKVHKETKENLGDLVVQVEIPRISGEKMVILPNFSSINITS